MTNCEFCDIRLGNAYYRDTLHVNAYHDLLSKIHQKIAELETEAGQGMVADYRHGYSDQADLLKSLIKSSSDV